jgi:hypothetical protein
MDRNRSRATTRALTIAVVIAAGALGTACTSSQSSPAAHATSPLPSTPASPTSRDAVADCANQIDYWVTTEYLQGKPDRGDYQEMGLGSAEGLALRQLERHLAETIKSFPAPAPGNLHQQEIAACDAAGASATATGTKAPVWP